MFGPFCGPNSDLSTQSCLYSAYGETVNTRLEFAISCSCLRMAQRKPKMRHPKIYRCDQYIIKRSKIWSTYFIVKRQCNEYMAPSIQRIPICVGSRNSDVAGPAETIVQMTALGGWVRRIRTFSTAAFQPSAQILETLGATSSLLDGTRINGE